MAVFQSTVFERLYTFQVIRNTISEIDESLPLEDTASIENFVLEFSQNTQTTTAMVPTQQLAFTNNYLTLKVIDVQTDDDTFSIYVPNNKASYYQVGNDVSSSILYIQATDKYLPITLNINDQNIIQSKNGNLNPFYREYFPNINTDNAVTISGIITDVRESQSAINTTSINPIISNEILNILSQSYERARSFDVQSYYYYSIDDNKEEQNLVFIVNTEIDSIPHLFISVFPVAHITDVVTTVRNINFLTFMLVLVILFIASFFYSKQFSKPLITINDATKKLSDLDFENATIEIDNQDEFGELASHINSLSINLQTTLKQLSKQNQQLSKQIELENQNEQKRKDFIRGMSHELKTPLSVIQAASEGLENHVFDTKESQQIQLKTIQNEVVKTNKLIKNMMAVYRLDNSNYVESYTSFELNHLIENVIDRMTLLIDNKLITLKTNIEPVRVTSDKDKLELVISNLINNAIKYTPRNRSIHIVLKTTKTGTRFDIINYGTSIPEESIPQLFEPFYRVNKERSRQDGSTGLGLYIVEQTLQQLGSSCHVENIDDGVHFYFTLQASNI
jgi:signal transduction histidine kinase